MTLIVIGSIATKYHFPEARIPKDIDYFSDWREPDDDESDIFWHPSLGEWFGTDHRYATPDELYTIKVSHSYWELDNGSWNKHIYDVLFLKSKGCKLIPELHSLLYKIWEEKHGKKKVDLTKESEDFFRDAVPRVYDHDSIHSSVAYFDVPMYTKVLKEGASVQMDMSAVWALPFDDQVRLFREEVYATALERLMIPKNYKFSPGRAYTWALRRTITSLTKGRSATFIVDNMDIFSKPDVDYVARHLANSDKLIKLDRKEPSAYSVPNV